MKGKKIVLCLIVTLLVIAFGCSGTEDSPRMPDFKNRELLTLEDSAQLIIDVYEYFCSLPPEEGLRMAVEYFEIESPEAVYAFADSITDHFHSRICTEYNNIFGIYDHFNNDYCIYNSWFESFLDYNDLMREERTRK